MSEYTDDEILDMLQACKEEYGKCSPRLFKQLEGDTGVKTCSPTTVMARFGSWSEAKEEAGIDEDLSTESGRERTYSNEQLLSHLRELYRREGKVTTSALAEQEDLAAPSVVVSRFQDADVPWEAKGYDKEPGGWTKAKILAEVDDKEEDIQKGRPQQFTRDELLEMIREIYEEQGSVSQRDFDEKAEASSGAIRKRFESWNAAKEEAGVDSVSESRAYSDEELLEMLRTCQKRYGNCTSMIFASDDEFCSPDTVRRHFGKWSIAKNKAFSEQTVS